MKCAMCGVCCVAVSINSPELCKPAGVRCQYLKDSKCSVWGDVSRQPSVCRTIRPAVDLCYPGKNTKEHFAGLWSLERATRP